MVASGDEDLGDDLGPFGQTEADRLGERLGELEEALTESNLIRIAQLATRTFAAFRGLMPDEVAYRMTEMVLAEVLEEFI